MRFKYLRHEKFYNPFLDFNFRLHSSQTLTNTWQRTFHHTLDISDVTLSTRYQKNTAMFN